MKITRDLLQKVYMAVQELNNPFFRAKMIRRKLQQRYGISIPTQVVGKALSILASAGYLEKLDVDKNVLRYRRIDRTT